MFGQVIGFEEVVIDNFGTRVCLPGVKVLIFEDERWYSNTYERTIFEEQADYLLVSDIIEIMLHPTNFAVLGRIRGRTDMPNMYRSLDRRAIPPVPRTNPPTDEEILAWNSYVRTQRAARDPVLEVRSGPIDSNWVVEGF